jgi:small subunit ribosomal protein S21
LRCREANTRRIVHGLDHVRYQSRKIIRGKVDDSICASQQYRISHPDNLENSHAPIYTGGTILSGAACVATLHKQCDNVLRTRPLYQPHLPHGKGEEFLVQVIVRDNNVDQALKALKKKMQREGIFREMKRRRSYEKPSEKRAREQAEAVRRARKLERKRVEREGF